MKGSLLTGTTRIRASIVFTVSLLFLLHVQVDAFLPLPHHPRAVAALAAAAAHRHRHHHRLLLHATTTTATDNTTATTCTTTPQEGFTHADICWKLRPPPETPLLKKWMLRLSANAIRLDCWLRRVDPPYCLVPKGGQAVLEAHHHHHHHHQSNRRIARFGITTVRGPPAQPIRDSVERIYSVTTGGAAVGTAAIIYMFVEEPFRDKNVGTLALQVISTIHSIQGCDFTILVADDNGSGKLVRWYERHGFSRAPLLQDMLGSPGGKYGIAMIAPTRNGIDPLCRIEWW